jgi:nucleoside-diphosphate-sugar epimerase
MLLRRVLGAQPLIDSDPPLYSNRIHVDDAANALVHMIELAATGIVNLVDDAPVAQSEVLDWIADALGVPLLSGVSGASAVENKRVSNAHLRAFGFEFSHADYRSGYRDILRAFLARPPE